MSRLYIFRNLLMLEKTRFHFQQLGLLRCGDTMVFYALKERLHRDSDQRVRYEATKSLILIGETIPWLICCVFICVWSTLSLIVVSDGIGQFYMLCWFLLSKMWTVFVLFFALNLWSYQTPSCHQWDLSHFSDIQAAGRMRCWRWFWSSWSLVTQRSALTSSIPSLMARMSCMWIR